MSKRIRARRTGKRLAVDVIFALLIAVFMAVSFYDFTKRVEQSMHKKAEQTLSEMSQESANLLEAQIGRDFNFLHTMAALMVADGSVEDPALLLRNLQLGSENYSFDRMTFIRPDGQALTSDGAQKNLGERAYFKKALGGEDAVSEILVSAFTGKDGFAVAVPVYRDGAVMGVLSGGYVSETFNNVVSMHMYGGEGITHVVQPDGTYVLLPKTDKLVEKESWDASSDSEERIREKMENGESGYATFYGENENWQFSYVPTTVNNWYVVTLVPERVIMDQSEYIGEMALVLCAKVGLALLAVGIYVFINQRKAYRRERERRELAHMDNERYRILLENMDALFFEWNLDDKTLSSSKEWEERVGYTPDLPCIQSGSFVDEPESLSFTGFLESVLGGLPYGEEEYHLVRQDGTVFWCRIRLSSVKDQQGKVRRVMGLIEDIDSQKKREVQLMNQASRDSLTNLYNKKATEEQITFILKNEKRKVFCHGFLLFDIDDFKGINDTYGHHVGDQVLKNIAACLLQQFRSSDVVGRIGGDEFAVLLRSVTGPEAVAKKADELITAFRKIHVAGDQWLTCSLGVAIAEIPETDFQTLYCHADTAMYEAKRKGKNQYAIYENVVEN